jgi:hypothetical protein
VEATVAHDKQKSSFRNFKDKYQEADILLIDDIQYLQGKEQTLDIVFQIFNRMVDEGKQVVLSADRAPKNITMDERYQSRFNSGGTFDIQPPEVETKLGIIKSFVEEYKQTGELDDFDISEEVERYIAENSSSNIRELKSAVTKVIYDMTLFNRRDITIEQVSQVLENHFSGGAMKKLSVSDIQKQVELYYDVPHSDLVGAKRARKIVYARQIAIYLSRQMLDLPYNTIAKSFGGRDHTTIMYSVTNVEEKMKENRELREDIEAIKADFSAFRLRYEDIYSKEILEVFSLNDLWQETFRQELDDEERIVIATNKFKPDNILVGQGYIAAESRKKAIEWLNIVRTALIFVDDNEDDLKRQLPSNDETKPPEVIDDYEIPNTFENFWD